MSKTLVTRTQWTNDSGQGIDGTIVGNEELQEIFDAIDDVIGQVVQIKSANYTADIEDDLIKVSSGTWTLTLFTAVGTDGKALDIVNVGTGSVTVDPNGSQTIGGLSTWRLGPNQALRIRSDGANWVIVANSTCQSWVEEIPLPMSFFSPHGVNGCGGLENILLSSGRYANACPFDATNIESASCFFSMPKRWNLGSFTFTPYGFNTAGGAANGVVLQMGAVATGDGDTKDSAIGTLQTSVDTAQAAKAQMIGPTSAPITIAGSPVNNDGIRFVLQRDPTSGSDTYGSDHYVEQVLIRATFIAFNDE